MRFTFASALLVAIVALSGTGTVSAQQIKFYNRQGANIRSWKLGDVVVVEVTRGDRALTHVEIGWVSGYAGAPMNIIATVPTITGVNCVALFPLQVSITRRCASR